MHNYLTNLDPLAIWGAVLSSALAFIKIYETWINRNRFELDYIFRPEGLGGNTILVRNISSKKRTLSYWLLQRRKRKFKIFWSTVNLDGPDDDEFCNIEIDRFSSYQLHFDNERYFSTHRKVWGRDQLFLKLYVVGRRLPVTLKVHSWNYKNA